MTRRRLAWLLGLTLPLIALWSWRSHVNARRAADQALFFAYVDGPLNDYSYAVTRALPALLKGDRRELPDARVSARKALDALRAQAQAAPQGWIKSRLEFVLPLYGRLDALLNAMPRDKAAAAAWLADEQEIREKVIYMLEEVRFQSFGKWKVTQSSLLELNALIYSLKEAQEAAAH